MKLIDPNGPEWRSIKEQLETMLEEERKRLEDYLPEHLYHETRGRVSMIRHLLSADQPEEPVVIHKPVDYLRR